MWPFKKIPKNLVAVAEADLEVCSPLFGGKWHEKLTLFFYVDDNGKRSYQFSDSLSVGVSEMIGGAKIWKEAGILPKWAIKISDYKG